MYHYIVVAIDLDHLDQAKALIAQAKQMLDPAGEIRLLHVLEEMPSYISAGLPAALSERRRAEAAVELRALIDPDSPLRQSHQIRQGVPSGQIIQEAQDQNADLIMIASHKPGLSDYFIGSTAARVVRHAGCSVLVDR